MNRLIMMAWLCVAGWFSLVPHAMAAVDTVYTASYNGHAFRIEIESGFFENQYKVYLDNQTVGTGKMVGMGGLNRVTSTVDGKKWLVTLKQGVLSPSVNLFIHGTEVELTH